METIEQLADQVRSTLRKKGDRFEIDVPDFDRLQFHGGQYEMRYQELDALLGAGYQQSTDVTPGSHRVVITRLA
jgi:hypothetical protein